MAYTVKFSSGETIKFDTVPTQADIEKAATKMGINKSLPIPPVGQVGQTLDQIQKPSLGQRLKEDITSSAQGVTDNISNTTQSPLLSGLKATAAGFGALGKVGETILSTAVSPVISRDTQAQAGEAVGGLFSKLSDKISDSTALQNFVTKHPEAANDLDSILQGVQAGGEIAGNIAGAEGARALGATADRGIVNAASAIKKGSAALDSKVSSFGESLKGGSKSIDDEALDLVRKPQSAGYQKLAAEEGRFVQEPGLLGKRKIAPDATEKAMADAVKPLIEEGKISKKMNIIEQQKVIDDEARALNSKIKSDLNNPETGTQPFNNKQLDSRFKELKSNRDIELQSEPSANRAYDAVVKKFKSYIKTNDTKGLFEARQQFDAYMRKNYPGAFRRGAGGDLTPTNNAINSAFYDVRNSVNETIAEALPTYRDVITREARLINAADNIGYRELVGTGGTNKISRLFSGKSTKDKLLQAAAIGTAGAVAGSIGTGIVSAAGGGRD